MGESNLQNQLSYRYKTTTSTMRITAHCSPFYTMQMYRDGEFLLVMVTVPICSGLKKIPVTSTCNYGTGLFKSGTNNSDDPKR